MNIIVKIVSLEFIWLTIFFVLFSMIHIWRQDRGAKHVIAFLITDIITALVASYPLW